MRSNVRQAPARAVAPPRTAWQALRFGLGMAALQLAFAMVVTGGNWADLAHWDVGRYAYLIDHGYHSTIPPMAGNLDLADVGFFPGHVLWGGLFHYGLGLRTDAALVLASQVAAAGFWTYFGLMLRALGLAPQMVLGLSLTLLLQPGSLYLINGHSESLFLLAMAGLVYWTEIGTRRPAALALAALHGVVMTGTRLVGAIVVIYPLLRVGIDLWLDRRKGRGQPVLGPALLAVLAAAASLAGAGAFLVYCAVAIGKWDIYFDTERIVSKMYVDWPKLLWPEQLFRFTLSGKDPTGSGKFLTLAVLAAGPFLLWGALRRTARQPWMLALALTAYLLLGETLAGRSAAGYYGMIRHVLPVTILLLPVLGELWRQRMDWARMTQRARLRWILAAAVAALLLAGLQGVYLYRYVTGLWVA